METGKSKVSEGRSAGWRPREELMLQFNSEGHLKLNHTAPKKNLNLNLQMRLKDAK